MYQIYADDVLIYDSTLDDYKIAKGSVTLETNKAGSFVFSLYPDHFFYDSFVALKTVITVYKFGKIVFRGRIIDESVDHWNNKVCTCEGELGFLQDSIIRPFSFSGTPIELLSKLISEHNSQVDEFKRFKIGSVTTTLNVVVENTDYQSTYTNLTSESVHGHLNGYIYITHDDGDPIPTINYLSDFTKVSTQTIEFGSNLKQYAKTVNSKEIATAIIPIGAEIDDGNSETPNSKTTIADVNDGLDFVYSPTGVALRGWIFRVVQWDDISDPQSLKTIAEQYVESSVNQNITLELTAIDLHLLDKTIESFGVNEYVPVVSNPHRLNTMLLCNKQTLNLLKPENDSIVLGHTLSMFTDSNKFVHDLSTKLKRLSNTIVETQRNTNNTIVNIITRLDQLAYNLPIGYTALSYIESNGTQYIDTGFMPNQDTKVVMRYYSAGIPSEKILFGARTAYKNTAFGLWIQDTYYQTDYGNYADKMNVTTTGDVIVIKDKNVTSMSNSDVKVTSTVSTFQCGYTMFLFTLNQAGTAHASMSSIRLYSCAIYDDDTLVRNFVPCKNESGVIGLYDTVGLKFYKNAGTGEFTGG